jgi:hypothetical protein
MRYDFDALVFSGGRAGLRPSIMTFGGDRERFGLPSEVNAFLIENDVWRFARLEVSDSAALLDDLLVAVTGVGPGRILERTVVQAQVDYDSGDTKQQATCAVMKFFDFEVKLFNSAAHRRSAPSWAIEDAVADPLLELSGQIQIEIGCTSWPRRR